MLASTTFSLILLLTQSQTANANQVPKLNELLEKIGATKDMLALCEKKGFSLENQDVLQTCLQEQAEMEYIEVTGQYIGLEVPEVVGRYYFNRKFIQQAPQGNGDINEIIALLPGVELSENAYSLDSLSSINAQEISISGGQPWQTGFFIDGMNYNSRIDPANEGTQSMNINTHIVEGITVFDNNIPAEYGHFSGGVVEVDTISALQQKSNTQVNLKVRGTDNTLVDFHMLNGENNRLDTQGLASPQFDKQNYSLTLGQKITEQHGILFSANYLESIVSDISLGETKNKERSNINLLTKYSYRDGWLDQLDVSFIYAPYEEKDFLRDVLNSDYTTDGGAYGTALKINHALKYGELDFSLSGNLSEKSRQAPPHYYSWIQARGREWGQEANQSQGSVLLSQEGGTGNLENTQTSLTSKTKFSFNEFHWAGSTHHFQMGAQVDYEEIQRLRQIDHFEYSNAVQYSTALGTQPLNCSGYTTDCVELTLISPIEELEARLGGEIDFTNPEHIEAYSDNILITPQYFRTRLVNPQEDIQVDLMRYSLFASNDITIDALSVYLGLRADYDNIFENLNLAPRFSLSYDIFGDRSAAAIVGLNRYYDVGLLADRINEQKIPTFLQYRTIRDGFLQSWLDSSFVTDFRYRFVDVDTPYDDELLIAWKQSLNTWGTWAIKYVYREKNDQLATNEEPIREADGYSYLQLNNLGYGESERFSLSWNGRFYEHNFWFNLSHQTNTSNVNDYTNSIDGTRRDDLVYYEGQEISRAELNVIKSNFGRPFTASFGWSRTWFEQLTLVASGNYSSAYKTAVNTGSFTLSNILIQTCDTCQANYLIVPVYREEKKESRVFINLGVNWDYSISPRQKLSLDLDILNLFNRRTYTVNNGQSGIEPGRQLWLGLSYQYQ